MWNCFHTSIYVSTLHSILTYLLGEYYLLSTQFMNWMGGSEDNSTGYDYL